MPALMKPLFGPEQLTVPKARAGISLLRQQMTVAATKMVRLMMLMVSRARWEIRGLVTRKNNMAP